VTEVRPERPVLATVICIFEVAVVVLAIAAHFLRVVLLNALHHTHRAVDSSALTTLHFSALHYAREGLAGILALAAAIALWQMHRAAFYILAARTAMEAAGFLVSLRHPASVTRLVFNLAALALSAAITWYVYVITKPQAEAAYIPPEATRAEKSVESQSVSQFYLAPDDEQKGSK
jgi:hypothetical protein